MHERSQAIQRIVDFVNDHRGSYASLAVCRRAIDSGLDEITDPIIAQLEEHLKVAPPEEIDAYYSIVT